MYTIALADDHAPTLKRFADFFKNLPEYTTVVEAVNGHDLILKIKCLEQLPDIVLIDINMPVIDGVAVTHYLRVYYPSIKLIGLSNYGDENSLRDMLLSGANGFVMKALSETILQEAVEAVMNNKVFIDKRMGIDQQQVKFILHKQKEKKERIKRIKNEFGLTDRELAFIILNATTLSYGQIAETMYVETKTVHTYFSRASKKFNISNRQALTIYSLQNGLASIADYK
jgi:DNA-binding NarL/FixJ family response regulator